MFLFSILEVEMNVEPLAELGSSVSAFLHILADFYTHQKRVNYLWRAHSASRWPFSGTPAVPSHPKLLKQRLGGGRSGGVME